MYSGTVEHRDLPILFVDQQADVGAPEDDALGTAWHEPGRDLGVPRLGSRTHRADAQFVVDHIVKGFVIGAVRYNDSQAVLITEATPAEIVLSW